MGEKEKAVVAVDGFTTGLLVTGTGTVGNAGGPGVASEEVKVAGDGIVGIGRAGVSSVSCDSIKKLNSFKMCN